jgi:pimeloyl-ACP methyl ester carboxylesterase
MRELIDIGGRRLWVEAAGDAQPTIVLEAGGACASDTWQPVWKELTQLTRVCRYDRAGLGQSDRAQTPRTSAGVVADLHTVLQHVALSPPYLLVGHSFGALIACLYANQYRDSVVGLVLLDPTPPDPLGRWLAVLPPATPSDSATVRSLRDWVTLQCYDPSWNDEGIDQASSFKEFQQVASLNAVPVTVLLSAIPPWNDDRELAPELAATFAQTVQEMAADVLRLSSQSQLISATTSGHFIHHDQPKLVVEAISEVVQHWRATDQFARSAKATSTSRPNPGL